MKRKLIGIVLIFLGVIMAAGAWLTYSEAPKAQEELKSAVFLEKPVVLQENEGKLVVCSGTMEMTAPARDKDLGLSFPSPRVRRRTEQRKVDGDKRNGLSFMWTVPTATTSTAKRRSESSICRRNC